MLPALQSSDPLTERISEWLALQERERKMQNIHLDGNYHNTVILKKSLP